MKIALDLDHAIPVVAVLGTLIILFLPFLAP